MTRDQRQALLLVVVILGAALLLALGGYELLLYQEKPVGTLDNVVTFIVGTLAGSVTTGAGAALYVNRRPPTPTPVVDELEPVEPDPTQPPPWAGIVADHDRIEGA